MSSYEDAPITWLLRTVLDMPFGQTEEGRTRAFKFAENKEIKLRDTLRPLNFTSFNEQAPLITRTLRDSLDTPLGQTPQGRIDAFQLAEMTEIKLRDELRTLHNNLENVERVTRSLEVELENARDAVRCLRDGYYVVDV